MKWVVLLCALSSSLMAKPAVYSSPELDEVRLEIDDIKQLLHTTQVDLALLEERSKKPKEASSQLVALEKKVAALEQMLDKVVADLRSVSTTLSQVLLEAQRVDSRLTQQDERLHEVGKLKTTLTSIAKAVNTPAAPSSKSYKVKAGDSLEKIAKHHHTSAEVLRKLNHLTQDKIIVGQELKVPDEP